AYASDPSVEGTNNRGFSGLPGGVRTIDGDYDNMGYWGNWWSSTQYGSYFAWARGMDYNLTNVFRNLYYTQVGWGVRCLRD
ncbi:MAG: FISUMP domain-containing protein, partial [Flavobacteriales bacterium]